MGIFAWLSLALKILKEIPALVKMFQTIQRDAAAASVKKAEAAREAAAKENMDKLIKAQEAGDEKAQQDALSGAVSDYNS